MRLPDSVMRELHGRLVTYDLPVFGQVEIKLLLHVADQEIQKYSLSIGSMESLKP